jgi:hypothetical protein
MGLDAQVIAVGHFSQAVLPALEYAPDLYATVPPGATVVTNVFIATSSGGSHSLASAFNVGALELGKHVLDADVADLDALAALFGEVEVARFQLLRTQGFVFYYLPNA